MAGQHLLQVGISYGFSQIGEALERQRTVEDSIHRRVSLNLVKLGLYGELSSGTSLGLNLPFGHLAYRSDLQETSTTGIADVSLRLGQDLGRFYRSAPAFVPRVYVGVGVLAPTGEAAGHMNSSGGAKWFSERPGIEDITTVTATLGRGTWFGLGDIGMSVALAGGLSMTLGTQLRFPLEESDQGMDWGEEVFTRAGIGVELADGLLALTATASHVWRDTIVEMHGDQRLIQTNSGGQVWSASTGLEVRPVSGLRIRTSVRVPVASDLNGAQLGETISTFFDVSWAFGISSSSEDESPTPTPTPTPEAVFIPDPPVEKSAGFPVVVTGGAAFESADIVVPGKITVIDYFADWCVPCERLEKEMADALAGDPDIVVVKVDIVDWDTPAAQRIEGVSGLPVLDIHDAEGTFVERLVGDRAFQFKKHLEDIRSGKNAD